MFNIGGGEFLVIALIALIVLGPQRLPEAARQVGKVMGDLRRLSAGFQSELQGALDPKEKAAPATARDVLAAAATDPGIDAGADVGADVGADAVTEPRSAPRRPARREPLQARPVPKAPRSRTKGP